MDPIDTVYVKEEEIFNENSSKTSPENERASRTEETIDNLEQEIDKAYGVVEAKFQDLWNDNADLLQNKYHLDEHKQSLVRQLNTLKANVSENKNLQAASEGFRAFEEQLKQANLEQRLHVNELKKTATSALDALDSRLEIVENKANEYVTQFTSFFSNIVSVRPETDPEQPQDDKEVLYSSPLNKYTQYGTTRYERDLLKLHTTEAYFTEDGNDDPEELKQFNSDSKTTEIDNLLKKYPDTLTEMMNELVPVRVSYNTFWYRYFKNEEKLKELDEQRKNLLRKEKNGEETTGKTNEKEEDDFTWDDEDEEETPVKVDKPKESETASNTRSEKSKVKVGDGVDKNDNDDDDDDDDDWE
ncbi:hypothetical protein CANMA_004456 [Candida margitis]|uniref:uncharacterized protein n=1 Tax=Candida margitis TaxID=1775924 RepID=UPI002225CAFA|nr:uncharacterized protein CANMA_004456 [Candida margitis]KAI5957043.1 hypothetical protein CANMA_004456 [Candida margitis]